MPVFNARNYLTKSLDSLVNQTYSNLEIIIIDDGSVDGSRDIYDKYSEMDSRILVKKQKNMGISSARNVGILEATGDYIFFLDADDWIGLDYIENCVNEICKEKIDLLITPYVREYKNQPLKNDLFTFKNKYFNTSEVKLLLLRRLIGEYHHELSKPAAMDDFSPVWGKFYRTDYCKKLHFENTDLIGNEDGWFNINYVHMISNAKYFGNEYYHYNKQNLGSFVTKYNPKLYYGWLHLYKFISEFINDNELDATFYEALNNRVVLDLMTLMRNIVNSNLSYMNKREKAMLILTNDVYKDAFAKFDFRYLPFSWKIFFKFCKKKNYFLIYLMLRIAEPLKSKLK